MTEASSTPSHSGSDTELDAESLAAIRSILTEDPTPKPQSAAVAMGAEAEVPGHVAVQAPRRRRKSDAFPALEEPVTDSEANARAAKVLSAKKGTSKQAKRCFSFTRKPAALKAEAATQAPATASFLDKFKGYRPKPLHIGLAVFAVLVLMRPWLFIGLGVIFFIIMVGVYLMVGYDGFWRGAMRISRWYASRQPDRAVKLHARLDRFAMRWDAVLDKFPDGSVDALYLPDFGELAAADRRHDSAMERRLAGLQESGS